MRKLWILAVRLMAMFFLALSMSGCPVALPYPLTDTPDPLDPALLGTWVALSDEAEIQEVALTKKNNTTYLVKVLKQGAFYAAEGVDFEAQITRFEGRSILIARSVDAPDEGWFHYDVSVKEGLLVVHDLSLLVGGMDAVTSTQALRKELAASLKNPECLTGELVYDRN